MIRMVGSGLGGVGGEVGIEEGVEVEVEIKDDVEGGMMTDGSEDTMRSDGLLVLAPHG